MTVKPTTQKVASDDLDITVPQQVFVDSPAEATAVLVGEPVVYDSAVTTNSATTARTGDAADYSPSGNCWRGCGFDILICGDVRLTGRRIVRRGGGCSTFVRLCGNVTVDLRGAPQLLQPQPKKLRFFIVALCGDVKFIVPRGMDIVVRRIALCGDKDIDIDDEALTNNVGSMTLSPPTVIVTIIELCGSLRVKNNDDDDE